ncbi:hypothetical protein [Tenacibaculum sp. M341]|uniref:hypothetical protein n=1 Tax=Tenacibaculum sp. M341 TaxID=2530339 RepID=UPI001052EA79|nr:hypothetical protein [Tenacibaculum sp. M341]TCI93599.1 hypothetical protein EYW44_04095 [Tenacibaculum sp. M341]
MYLLKLKTNTFDSFFRNTKNWKLILVLILINIVFGCSPDEKILSEEANIIHLTLEAENVEYTTSISANGEITMDSEIPFYIQFLKVKSIQISDGAKSNITVGKSLSTEEINHKIIITAQNREVKKEFTLTLSRETKIEILKLVLEANGEEITTSVSDGKIELNSKLPYGTTLIKVKEIEVSEGALATVKAGDTFNALQSPTDITVKNQRYEIIYRIFFVLKNISIEKATACYLDIKWDEALNVDSYKLIVRDTDNNVNQEVLLSSQELTHRFNVLNDTNYTIKLEVKKTDGNVFQSSEIDIKTDRFSAHKRLFFLSDGSIKTLFLDNGDFITVGRIQEGGFSNDFGYIARFTKQGNKVWEYRVESPDEFRYFSDAVLDDGYIYAIGHGFKNIGSVKLDLNGNVISKYLEPTQNDLRSSSFTKVGDKYLAVISKAPTLVTVITYFYWFDSDLNIISKDTLEPQFRPERTYIGKIFVLNDSEIMLTGDISEGLSSIGVYFARYNIENKIITSEKFLNETTSPSMRFIQETPDGNFIIGINNAPNVSDLSTWYFDVYKIDSNINILQSFRLDKRIPNNNSAQDNIDQTNTFYNVSQRPNGEFWLLGSTYSRDFTSVGIDFSNNKNIGAIFKLSSDFKLSDIVTFYGNIEKRRYFDAGFINDNNDGTFTVISPNTSVQLGIILEDGTPIECQ